MYNSILFLFTDYDTDEETDELLDKQYVRSESEQVDIPELSRPPVNRSAQVSPQAEVNSSSDPLSTEALR